MSPTNPRRADIVYHDNLKYPNLKRSLGVAARGLLDAGFEDSAESLAVQVEHWAHFNKPVFKGSTSSEWDMITLNGDMVPVVKMMDTTLIFSLSSNKFIKDILARSWGIEDKRAYKRALKGVFTDNTARDALADALKAELRHGWAKNDHPIFIGDWEQNICKRASQIQAKAFRVKIQFELANENLEVSSFKVKSSSSGVVITMVVRSQMEIIGEPRRASLDPMVSRVARAYRLRVASRMKQGTT